MTGIGHLIMGASVSAAVVNQIPSLPLEQKFGLIIVGSVASLLPDTDASESVIKVAVRGGNRAKIADGLVGYRDRRTILGGLVHGLLSAGELAIRAVLVLLMDIVHSVFGHRGVTHYLITGSILAFILLGISLIFGWHWFYGPIFFIGYTIHLLGDSCTARGLKLLKPFSDFEFHLLPKKLRITTGKGITFREIVYVLIVVLISLVFIP